MLETGSIVLPVPASIRELEEKQRIELQESLDKLEKAGVNLDQIPKKELEEGDGEVLKALRTWHNYIDSLERLQKSERVAELEDLRLRLEAWRSDMAVKFRMSPADVMPEHLLVKVAYAAASLKSGKLEKEALLAVGIRSGGIDDLESIIACWLDETLETKSSHEVGNSSCKMILLDAIFKPLQPWEHFVYKPVKKTGLACWESSYKRFMSGEHPQTIAMSPANGRPITVATVIFHILDGMVSGRPVDFKRLSNFVSFPDKEQWEIMKGIEVDTNMDVTDGGSFKMTDFLVPVMGNMFAAKEYSERTEEENALFSKWCQLLKCYMAMRRIGYIPIFENNDDKSTAIVEEE